MTGADIVAKVTALGLKPGTYVVFGSCPLAVAGLRESNDIDMLVSPAVLADLQQRGWTQAPDEAGDQPFTYDVFEAHTAWRFGAYNPTLAELLETADTIDGVAFASLREVRKWKLAAGRPKDAADIALIDAYLQKQPEATA